MRSVISISLTSLENIGLSKILENIPPISLTVAEDLTLEDMDLDNYELIVTKPEYLAKNINRMLPLKRKILVLVSGAECGNGTFRSVGVDSGIEKFIKTISSMLDDKDGSNRLSSREIDVLIHLAAGKTQKEIADILCISSNTVVTHRKNISNKLGIRTISGLALYAALNGYINK